MHVRYDPAAPSTRGHPARALRALALVVAPLVLLAACDDDDDPVTPTPTEHEWQATLSGNEGWEHVTGEADARWTEGTTQFQTSASIAGDEPDAVRPWHVHFNTCAQGGGIVGQDGDYPRLEVDENGAASASVTVALPLDPDADYHVNVHFSDEDLGTIIACGDLDLVSDTGS